MGGVQIHPASYRDPSGFIFEYEGKYYRQVNKVYKEHYDYFIQCGLYKELVDKKLLLAHEEINKNFSGDEDFYITLLPGQLDFISYPYEWSFEQLKDAALLTLEIMKTGLRKKMILKDATAFNIQFQNGKPVFIDTLSFEKYDETRPWVAYRQFCECFLLPLLLGKYTGIHFQQLLCLYPDGIPLNLAAKLLPFRSRFNASVWLHVFLQNRISEKTRTRQPAVLFSKTKMNNLIQHLESIISGLDMNVRSAWSNYYKETILQNRYLSEKEKIVSEWLDSLSGKKILDLGTNDGHFSLLAAKKKFEVIAVDADQQCINTLYKKIKEENLQGITALCMDITNPSPDTGFDNTERQGFFRRIKVDTVMALALVHHLAIGKNIPLWKIAAFLHKTAPQLIIEFVPGGDEKVNLLLQHRKDIFPCYTKESFESSFKKHFATVDEKQIHGTERIIYLMKRL